MKILFTLVVYKEEPEKTSTFQTLINSLSDLAANNYEILIYDNSPESHRVANPEVHYFHNPRNPGIAQAYNYALDYAQKNDFSWLLLLDQDSQLTSAFLKNVFAQAENQFIAILPTVIAPTQQISPIYSSYISPLKHALPASGTYTDGIMGISSGVLISVAFLAKIGGFNQAFPLDYLDHWLFHEISKNKGPILVLPEKIVHDLSVLSMNDVSETRYKSIADAEYRYYKNYKKKLFFLYKLHLLPRFFKQLLLVKNKKIALYTLKKITHF